MSYLYPIQKSLTIGGRTFTEAEVARFESGTLTAGGGVILTSFVTTSTRFSPFRNGSNTVFQVGAAVSLKVVAIKMSTSGAASAGMQMTYSDDAATFDDTTMTNIVYQNGQASSPVISLPASGWSGLAGEMYLGGTGAFVIPSNKYPSFQASGGTVMVTIYCFID